jgi:hypothetical protein
VSTVTDRKAIRTRRWPVNDAMRQRLLAHDVLHDVEE